jgi:hypothetical protein
MRRLIHVVQDTENVLLSSTIVKLYHDNPTFSFSRTVGGAKLLMGRLSQFLVRGASVNEELDGIPGMTVHNDGTGLYIAREREREREYQK